MEGEAELVGLAQRCSKLGLEMSQVELGSLDSVRLGEPTSSAQSLYELKNMARLVQAREPAR